MKQQITLVILAIILSAFSTNNKPPTHLDKMELKGNIESIRKIVNVIKPTSGNILISSTLSAFNTTGMLREIIELKNHKLFSKKVFSYSAEDELMGYTDYNSDGSVYLEVICSNNEKGHITSEHYNRTSQKLYDEDRQRVDVEYEKIYKNLFTEVIYKSDFKGYTLEEKYLRADGSLSHKYTYKYDYKYKLLELKYFNSEGKSVKRIKYRYNKNGQVEESKTYISNRLALTSTFSYEYDSFNNWIRKYEERQVVENIFTEGISKDNILTKRIIKYNR